MFIDSFEKIAGIPEMVGKTIGTTKRVAREAQAGIKNWRKDVAQRTTAATRAASNPGRKVPGEALTNQRVKSLEAKGTPPTPDKVKDLAAKSKSDVKDRASRMVDSKEKNKPSFAQKHPYLTAGGAFLAGRYALGGGEKQQQTQQPQVIYPQQ